MTTTHYCALGVSEYSGHPIFNTLLYIYKYSENSDNSTDKAEGGLLRSPINVFIVACRHLLINYAPAVSEVVFRHLEVVVGALKKAHIFALRLLWYEGIQVISVRAHGCA